MGEGNREQTVADRPANCHHHVVACLNLLKLGSPMNLCVGLGAVRLIRPSITANVLTLFVNYFLSYICIYSPPRGEIVTQGW